MDKAARSVRRCDAAEAGAAGLTGLSTRAESQAALSPAYEPTFDFAGKQNDR
jgi:hypothetical protein